MKLHRTLLDRKSFDEAVYFDLNRAIEELERRSLDTEIDKYLIEILDFGMPTPLVESKDNAVIFRHVATSNYEILRFFEVVKDLENIKPLVLEYTQDRFLSINDWKHSLGKIRFNKGIDRLGNPIVEAKTIIDFSTSDNRPISEVNTVWGQSLVGFHHEMLSYHSVDMSKVHDISHWVMRAGSNARAYYKKFLSLFLKNNILFENFLLEKKEKRFTEEVVLPLIFEIEKESGYSPIIVALEPTETEGDDFWVSHPQKDMLVLNGKHW